MREWRRGEVRSCRGNDTEGVTLTQRAGALEGLESGREIPWSVFSKSTLDADRGTGPGRQEPRDQEEATAAIQAGGDEGLGDMRRSGWQSRWQEVARFWASSERRSNSLCRSPAEGQLQGGEAIIRGSEGPGSGG